MYQISKKEFEPKMKGSNDFVLVKRQNLKYFILSRCNTYEAIYIFSGPGLEPNTCQKELDSRLT